MTTLAHSITTPPALLQRWWQQLRDALSLPRDPQQMAADDAAAVRALADSYRQSDPSFASDLYAAADRHEHAAERAVVGR